MHPKSSFCHIETFYFDAIFNHRYSTVSLVNIFKFGNQGIVLATLFVYKDSNLLNFLRKRFFYKHLYISEGEPLIKIDDKEIIRGIINKNTQELVYTISMGDNELGFDLQFIKNTRGWKGKTYLGNWLVIPGFDVQGTIHLQGKDTHVVGKGYHDHNIYPIYAPLLNKGYHFGKITLDSIVITWANVMKNRGKEEHIVVVNREQKYILIDPEDIRFTVETQVKVHGKLIPERFYLTVENNDVKLNVNMEALNVHYIRIPMLNYWRYHLKTRGEIQIDGLFQKIDTLDISELLRFF